MVSVRVRPSLGLALLLLALLLAAQPPELLLVP